MAKNHDDYWVKQFAVEMKRKLAAARAKGRSCWQHCDPADLSYILREHVEKGDPRDVANFCMFLWALGDSIHAEPARADRQGVALPDEACNLLLAARNAIDQLPGYPKGAALCEEIDAFICRASSRPPLQQATAGHDADMPAACYAEAMAESRQGVALSDDHIIEKLEAIGMRWNGVPWGNIVASKRTQPVAELRTIIHASSSRAEEEIPERYVLVPKEPTDAMLDATRGPGMSPGRGTTEPSYRQMLAAAETPNVAQGE